MKSSEEIKKQIQNLEKELEEAKKMEIPKPLPVRDFEPLIKMVESHIKDIAEKGYADEDDKNYIFEMAMNTIYGKNIWKWYNKNNNR